MGERHILAHSRKIGETYFQNDAFERFKEKMIHYVNEVLFEMVKNP